MPISFINIKFKISICLPFFEQFFNKRRIIEQIVAKHIKKAGITLNQRLYSISIIMLRPLSSLAVREYKSTEYISQTLSSESQQLSFTCQGSGSGHLPIINLRVINFLSRKITKNNHILVLNLNKCQLNDEALMLLARGNWKSLRNLSLFNNRLTSQSFSPLSKASWKRIQKIDLSCNRFGSDDGKQLADCNWGKLTHLDLSGNSTKLVFITKMTANCWQGLKSVNISNNLLSNSSVPHLVTFKWSNLQSLDLQRNLLTDDGMCVLVKGHWKRLKMLYLSYNPFGLKGFTYLSGNGWGKQLKIEAINNSDAYGNLLPFSVMITRNLAKFIQLLKFPQKKLTVVLSKTSTSVSIRELMAAVFSQKGLQVVM